MGYRKLRKAPSLPICLIDPTSKGRADSRCAPALFALVSHGVDFGLRVGIQVTPAFRQRLQSFLI